VQCQANLRRDKQPPHLAAQSYLQYDKCMQITTPNKSKQQTRSDKSWSSGNHRLDIQRRKSGQLSSWCEHMTGTEICGMLKNFSGGRFS
jgi:hypothetical protein